MPSTTRGPLPSGTYWRRRLAMLSVALVLVLAFGKVLTHFSDGSGGDSQAAQAGSTTRSSFPPPGTTTSAGSTGTAHQAGSGAGRGSGNGKNRGKQASLSAAATPTPVVTPTPTPTVLAEPSGPCADDDVYITPTVASPVLGGSIGITLNLQTQSSEACTWKISPDTVTIKITSGPDTVWTSQECPKAVPTQDVVVRRTVATQVAMTWDAKRSDQYCTGRTAFVLPGTYDIYAAALAGEPTDVQVDLAAPVAAQVTETVTPTPTPTPTLTQAPTPSATSGGQHQGKHQGKHKSD